MLSVTRSCPLRLGAILSPSIPFGKVKIMVAGTWAVVPLLSKGESTTGEAVQIRAKRLGRKARRRINERQAKEKSGNMLTRTGGTEEVCCICVDEMHVREWHQIDLTISKRELFITSLLLVWVARQNGANPPSPNDVVSHYHNDDMWGHVACFRIRSCRMYSKGSVFCISSNPN